MIKNIGIKQLCILPTIIAAAMATPAQAQSNLTVYGNLDIGLVKESGNPTKMDRGYNNWLGFRGTEDLGGGLAASFNLQTRFAPDTGAQETGVFWQGESTLGLSSTSIGRLRLGRALSPLWATKWTFDPWYDSGTFGSVSFPYQTGTFYSDPTMALGGANFARISNGVFYDTPDFSGFQAHAALEAEKAAGASDRAAGLSLNYGQGPLAAMLAYQKNAAADTIYFLAASYNLGAATVMGSYAQGKVQNGAGDRLRERNWILAATYALGIDTLRAGYGRTEESGNHKVSFGYVHPLSKRTNLYADIYREKTLDSKNGFAAGMNHTF
ncbi:porin [Herminiimonas sp. CN]|uniref:porin n=1 Tax=Herminiimonas sp. CN TaxID=1349818 RepID=UPI0004733350|nr:porin [Herminiimonas sp. CN]